MFFTNEIIDMNAVQNDLKIKYFKNNYNNQLKSKFALNFLYLNIRSIRGSEKINQIESILENLHHTCHIIVLTETLIHFTHVDLKVEVVAVQSLSETTF